MIGLIEVNVKDIRLELVSDRNSDILKKIIIHHIGPVNTIFSDGLEGIIGLVDIHINI